MVEKFEELFQDDNYKNKFCNVWFFKKLVWLQASVKNVLNSKNEAEYLFGCFVDVLVFSM